MSLDMTTINKLAHLSRLHIDEKDLESLSTDLNKILGFVEQLKTVDTSDVTPMTSAVDFALLQREDQVSDGNYPQKVLSNAPQSTEGFYVVPKTVE